MANRKLPFGYCLRDGQVREETTEAEMVRLIFRRYGEGASYGKLADELNTTGCPYAPGRPWNKNMVARVLQDGRYIGGGAYPQIIPPESFRQAVAAKPDVSGRANHGEIKDIRVLARCAQCQNPMRRTRQNYWLCPHCMTVPAKIRDENLILCVGRLLRYLREHPESIAPAPASEGDSEAVQAAQEGLAHELERAEFDEAAAKAQAIALASARFDALGSGDYETMRLRHLLGGAEPGEGLDTALLRQVAAAILIHPSGAVGLKLKNGQTLESPAG